MTDNILIFTCVIRSTFFYQTCAFPRCNMKEFNITVNRSTPLVKSPQIQSATLHNPLPQYLHTYVWPFLFVWPVFFAIYFSQERYATYIAGSEWTFVWAGSIITIQTLTWLTTKWNVNVDALFTTLSTKEVSSAQLIKVTPITNAGSAEICPLIRKVVS